MEQLRSIARVIAAIVMMATLCETFSTATSMQGLVKHQKVSAAGGVSCQGGCWTEAKPSARPRTAVESGKVSRRIGSQGPTMSIEGRRSAVGILAFALADLALPSANAAGLPDAPPAPASESPLGVPASAPGAYKATSGLPDDEYELTFGPGPLGIDLTEVRFPLYAPPERQSSRIVVQGLKPGSQAERLGQAKRLRPQVLVVSVDGFNVEGLPGKKAIKALQDRKIQADAEGRGLKIVFRDPLLFKEKLLNSEKGSSVSTQVGPGSNEQFIINTTFSPPVCGGVRSQQGDLLEVKYTGYLAATMEVFDGSSINAQGGFFGDQSIYFVLNQGQRQAPRAWEVGLLGMCIGEKRRLVVPPSLGYGAAGVPKGKIIPKLPVPGNATLIYDVTLVGINGINIPTDDPTSQGTRIPYDYRGCKTSLDGKSVVCGDDVEGRRL